MNQITSIGSYSFYNCTSLSTIYIDGTDTVPTLYKLAFNGLPSDYKIYVKNEDMYNKFIVADNWKDISSHITY